MVGEGSDCWQYRCEFEGYEGRMAIGLAGLDVGRGAGLLPSSSVNGGIRSTSVRSSLCVSKTNSFLLIANPNPNPDPNPNPMTLNQTQHISLDFPPGTL